VKDGPTYPEGDLTSCDREPIHIIGRIQSFGWLISFSSDWIVNHTSLNCDELTGTAAEQMIGRPAATFLSDDALHEIRGRLSMLGATEAVDRIFELDLTGDGRLFDCAVYRSGRSFVLECEESEAHKRRDYVTFVRPMIQRMRQESSPTKLAEMAARQVRGLTGFDRVKVYRFDASGAGEVIAESRSQQVDSFLGLHFPATDIPAQARNLYSRNLLRIISDVDDPTIPIIPSTNPDGEPLDLSMSGLRAVSPIHIEYLGNMGVKASMSISIMRRGKLWGLIACHHYSPLRLAYSVRTACELFGEFFSYILEQAETEATLARGTRSKRLHDDVMIRVARGSSLLDTLEDFADTIRTVIPFDGMAGWVNGRFLKLGAGPDEAQFEQLARFLNTAGAATVWATDNLAAIYPPAAEFADVAAGLLALPVSRTPRDYIVLFRGEFVREVKWAGNPDKATERSEDGVRLSPRKSFELWKQELRGHSRPWTSEEIATAEGLRITLLEVILHLSDAASRDRELAHRRQEFLIEELNHRVRNILQLVKGLVAQSRSGADNIERFSEIIGDRIYALARAHDQVTKTNWTPSSLYGLIRTECEAFAGLDLERVRISGPDAMLAPKAFTSLALVIHELMTNSGKYGALSDSGGLVSIGLVRLADGELELTWAESGGPRVNPPSRVGFGSTIIAQTVPHELGGKADVDFAPSGLVARFTIPPSAVSHFTDAPAASDGARTTMKAPGGPVRRQVGEALVVEDNVIIAMEAEQILEELGFATVHVCGSVAHALEVLDRGEISFALLDVELGRGENSSPVAEDLRRRGIPFAFASGYNETSRTLAQFPDVRTIAKPYALGSVRQVLHEIGLG